MCDNNIMCSICHDAIDIGSGYTIPECGHNSFHADCLMQWFRTGNNRCPLCNDIGITCQNPTRPFKELLKSAKKQAKQPDASELLIRVVKKLDKSENELKGIKAAIQQHYKTEGVFRVLLKRQRHLYQRHYIKQTEIIELRKTIQATFKITNLIIVTKKQIK
jgi:hypothetical protein